MRHVDLTGRVDRRCFRLCDDCNNNVWRCGGRLMCMQFFTSSSNVKWNKPKTKDGVYLCSNTHTHAHKHTLTHTHTFQQSFPPEQQLYSRHECWVQWADWSLGLLRHFSFSSPHTQTSDTRLRPKPSRQQIKQTWVNSNNTVYSPDISHTVSLTHFNSLHFFLHLQGRHVKDEKHLPTHRGKGTIKK